MKVKLAQDAERAKRIQEVERLQAQRGQQGPPVARPVGNGLSPALNQFANAIKMPTPKDEPDGADEKQGVRGRDFAERLGWSPAKFQNAVNSGQIPRPTKVTSKGNQYWPEAIVASTVKKLKD